MHTSSPDKVDLYNDMAEELILALSSSMCPSPPVVAHILMTVVMQMQTLLTPATRFARILTLMLACPPPGNTLPARPHPYGLVEGPDGEAPPSSEHQMPLHTDNIPLANPIYQQLTEPNSDHTRDHQQAQSHVIPTSGMHPPYTSSGLLNLSSSINPFETTRSTLFEQRSFEDLFGPPFSTTGA